MLMGGSFASGAALLVPARDYASIIRERCQFGYAGAHRYERLPHLRSFAAMRLNVEPMLAAQDDGPYRRPASFSDQAYSFRSMRPPDMRE